MKLSDGTLRCCYEPDEALCIAALNAHADAWRDEVEELEAENERLRERVKALEQNTSRSVLRRIDALLEGGE